MCPVELSTKHLLLHNRISVSRSEVHLEQLPRKTDSCRILIFWFLQHSSTSFNQQHCHKFLTINIVKIDFDCCCSSEFVCGQVQRIESAVTRSTEYLLSWHQVGSSTDFNCVTQLDIRSIPKPWESWFSMSNWVGLEAVELVIYLRTLVTAAFIFQFVI